MPDRSSMFTHTPAPVESLAGVIDEATTGGSEAPVPEGPAGAQGKNPHAAALGRLGGKKGGPARALKLSAERRSEIARNAARVRWHAKEGLERGG